MSAVLGQAVRRLWTPAHLSVAPRIWLDGDDAVFNGANLLQSIILKGTDGGAATVHGAVGRAALNGLNGMLFDGWGEAVSRAHDTWGTSGVFVAAFLIDIVDLAGESRGWLHRGSPSPNAGLTINVVENEIWAASQGWGQAPRATTYTSIGLHPVLVWIQLGATLKTYVNGVEVGVDIGESDPGAFPNLAAGTFVFGEAWAGGAEVLNGSIYQGLLLDYGPSTSDRQKLEGWAAWKYSLQGKLPAEHPHRNAPPTLPLAELAKAA